jgi:hypothetical protein
VPPLDLSRLGRGAPLEELEIVEVTEFALRLRVGETYSCAVDESLMISAVRLEPSAAYQRDGKRLDLGRFEVRLDGLRHAMLAYPVLALMDISFDAGDQAKRAAHALGVLEILKAGRPLPEGTAEFGIGEIVDALEGRMRIRGFPGQARRDIKTMIVDAPEEAETYVQLFGIRKRRIAK